MTNGQAQTPSAAALARELARAQHLANNQREAMFRFVPRAFGGIIITVLAVVVTDGLALLHVETPALIALVTALTAPSFVLLGLVVRGLFSVNAGKNTAAEPIE